MKFIRPKYIPKANLQSEIYHYCRNNNIKCCLDYELPNNDFNMVIINNDEIVLIIEFEKDNFHFSKEYIEKTQKKYDEIGVPMIVCNKWADIEFICKHIHRIIFGNI